MRFQAYAATVAGPRHTALNQPNQDALLVRNWHKQWLMVVCDGMGSRPQASMGSRQACLAVAYVLRRSAFDVSDRFLIQAVYQEWLRRLGNIPPNDAITTCLFAWGLNSGETRLFQLGDGAVYYYTDQFACLGERGTEQFSNETTGLGLSRKFSDWRCGVVHLTEPNHGVGLLTDGISDDLVGEDQLLPTLSRSLHSKSSRLGSLWLKKQLIDWDTPNHTDDKTIALIYRV